MLKRIREILAVALLALVFGAGMAVVLCVGALAVLVHSGKDRLDSDLCGGLFGAGGSGAPQRKTQRRLMS